MAMPAFYDVVAIAPVENLAIARNQGKGTGTKKAPPSVKWQS